MEQQHSKEPNKYIVFVFVAIGIFMSTLDGSIVNIALPSIMQDLATSLSVVKWVMIIYLLTVSSFLLSFGRLSDIKGRRVIYSIGLVIFSMGSFFCAISKTAFFLIAARSFQGVGAAMIMACTPALIVDTFPGPERGKYLGMIGAVVASGLTLGPAIGGFLLDQFSWRAIFYINIPIGLFAAVIIFLYLRGGSADSANSESFDIWGVLFLAVCIGSFILLLSKGYSWGIFSSSFISIGSVFIFSLILLINVERKSSFPILDMDLFTIRLFCFPVLSGIMLFTSLFTMVFLMPFYLMIQCNLPPSQAGNMLVIPFFFLFVIAPVSGGMSDKIGTRFLCTTGMVIIMVALYFLAKLPPSASLFQIGLRMAFVGIGIAIFTSPNTSAAMGAVPQKRRGIAGGIVAEARNLGMVIGVSIASVIFNSIYHEMTGGETLNQYRPEFEDAFMHAFRYAMMSGAIAAFLGVITAFLRGPEKREG